MFLKTRKTAGTSIEVFLERLAGADAIVTPIHPAVEGHVPRNYEQPAGRVGSLRQRRSGRWYFRNHVSAALIRAQIGRRAWGSYFTFCFERNPWEKTVSSYFHLRDDQRLGPGPRAAEFREYVLTGDLPSDFDMYSLDGRTVGVDFVGRYERLEDDLRTALDRLGLAPEISLTHEKSDHRPPGTGAVRLFDPEMSERVESVFAREIRAFGYRDPSTADRSVP